MMRTRAWQSTSSTWRAPRLKTKRRRHLKGPLCRFRCRCADFLLLCTAHVLLAAGECNLTGPACCKLAWCAVCVKGVDAVRVFDLLADEAQGLDETTAHPSLMLRKTSWRHAFDELRFI